VYVFSSSREAKAGGARVVYVESMMSTMLTYRWFKRYNVGHGQIKSHGLNEDKDEIAYLPTTPNRVRNYISILTVPICNPTDHLPALQTIVPELLECE
jgi:uncharacterized protein YodC (DUF2158 family)